MYVYIVEHQWVHSATASSRRWWWASRAGRQPQPASSSGTALCVAIPAPGRQFRALEEPQLRHRLQTLSGRSLCDSGRSTHPPTNTPTHPPTHHLRQMENLSRFFTFAIKVTYYVYVVKTVRTPVARSVPKCTCSIICMYIYYRFTSYGRGCESGMSRTKSQKCDSDDSKKCSK